MQNVIEVSYVWTRDEFVRASLLASTFSSSLLMRILYPLLAGLFVLVSGLLLFSGVPELRLYGFMLLAPPVLMFLAVSRSSRRWFLTRAFDKAGILAQPDQKVTFVIDDVRIRILTAGSDGSWIWELIPKVDMVKEGFLIHASARGHWLPYHAFTDERNIQRFADLVTEKSRLVRHKGAPDVLSYSGT